MEDMNKLTMGSKVPMEGGGGADSGSAKGNEGSPGRDGACYPRTSDEDLALLRQPEGSGFDRNLDSESEQDLRKSDRDTKEFFKAVVSKKKNIYSKDAVPLSSPWTFWEERTACGVNMQRYESNLKRMSTVFTVHRFWEVYDNTTRPRDLQCRSSLHVMRDVRKRVWEEAYNCKGGTFHLIVQTKDTDKVWKEMLLAMIGEQLNEYVAKDDEVCGVSVSIRAYEDVVMLWNKNAEVASQAKIFDCVRVLLPDTKFISTFYKETQRNLALQQRPLELMNHITLLKSLPAKEPLSSLHLPQNEVTNR